MTEDVSTPWRALAAAATVFLLGACREAPRDLVVNLVAEADEGYEFVNWTGDVGTIVDLHGVAIRTGHHCAMPVQDFFGVPATARASLGIYNTLEEIDTLAEALEKTRLMFG